MLTVKINNLGKFATMIELNYSIITWKVMAESYGNHAQYFGFRSRTDFDYH